MTAGTSLTQLILALVITNAGGEGKSTWAEILAAMARLGGRNVVVADVDPGNRGYLNRNGDGSAISLDWSPAGNGANGFPDPASWFDENLSGRGLAILDTGANMLAAANPINQFLSGLLQVARGREAKIVVFAVTSPNKAGSDELVEMIYDRFRRGAEVMVVQNDRDGSATFKSAAPLGTTVIRVPHLEPGLQAVRLRRCIPLDDILTQPEPGYERATAYIARRLIAAAQQQPVMEIVGQRAIDRLRSLSTNAPAATHYRISNIECADDASIDANERMANAWDGFCKADKHQTSTFLDASVALWEAHHAWRCRPR